MLSLVFSCVGVLEQGIVPEVHVTVTVQVTGITIPETHGGSEATSETTGLGVLTRSCHTIRDDHENVQTEGHFFRTFLKGFWGESGNLQSSHPIKTHEHGPPHGTTQRPRVKRGLASPVGDETGHEEETIPNDECVTISYHLLVSCFKHCQKRSSAFNRNLRDRPLSRSPMSPGGSMLMMMGWSPRSNTVSLHSRTTGLVSLVTSCPPC